jgi:hypothetical protein
MPPQDRIPTPRLKVSGQDSNLDGRSSSAKRSQSIVTATFTAEPIPQQSAECHVPNVISEVCPNSHSAAMVSISCQHRTKTRTISCTARTFFCAHQSPTISHLVGLTSPAQIFARPEILSRPSLIPPQLSELYSAAILHPKLAASQPERLSDQSRTLAVLLRGAFYSSDPQSGATRQRCMGQTARSLVPARSHGIFREIPHRRRSSVFRF